ncbi:MAG TPA: 2-oxo acid dehydrogenase subunit E2 [Cycloclasticus sp.]|jgi:pyruvate dehydrogenase E2 component (dihydrolipoamide acetyltransferase)|nr:2-oxo acid dehydrogenase subunit E2 [Cycloclasticus sp.]HIL91785.1 2-oxo acid dehydrogenase subunit E2 [Cycloclasticus sp.]
MNIFHLPDLGEGLPDADIVEWHVKVGDIISANDPLVSVETAKAIIDIPSPVSGTVTHLYGAVNDVIKTGDPLVEFEGEAQQDSTTVVGEVETSDSLIQEGSDKQKSATFNAKATPAIRALAHRMNVDLSMVTPSGHDGLIQSDDIRRVAKILADVGPMEPLRGVRRAMARNMTQSHAEVVPATVVDDADISLIESTADITPRLVRALIVACTAEPALNAWFDSHALGRRVLKPIHLGLAIDAPQGLFVAVLRDIEKQDLNGIKTKLSELKDKIEHRRFSADELRGYTITLSNYGSIAGQYAIPVVLPPTVAIIGAGKARQQPVVIDDDIVVRNILPLSITVDHRVVTGGEATRFLKALIIDLQQAT